MRLSCACCATGKGRPRCVAFGLLLVEEAHAMKPQTTTTTITTHRHTHRHTHTTPLCEGRTVGTAHVRADRWREARSFAQGGGGRSPGTMLPVLDYLVAALGVALCGAFGDPWQIVVGVATQVRDHCTYVVRHRRWCRTNSRSM